LQDNVEDVRNWNSNFEVVLDSSLSELLETIWFH